MSAQSQINTRIVWRLVFCSCGWLPTRDWFSITGEDIRRENRLHAKAHAEWAREQP